LAAGTIPKQLTRVFGPIPMDGIEIDPLIVEVGRDYFEMTEPNLNVIVGDGRYQFNLLDGPYDLVTLDAYKVPYIPWHLTTQDYFEEIRARLTSEGVVAVNVGRAPQDRRLVEALTATMLEVYPTVHAIDVPGTLNTILVATMQPTSAETLRQNLAALPADSDPLLVAALETAVAHQVPATAGDVIFTDQRAPVETIVDSLVLRYLLQEGLVGLPGLE
jgi:spermidine synthase